MNRYWTSLLLGSALVLGCETDKDGKRHPQHGGQPPIEREVEDTDETEINFSSVPSQVQAAFKKQYPGAKVEKVTKETYRDGTVHYEFDFDLNNRSREVEFDSNGALLEAH